MGAFVGSAIGLGISCFLIAFFRARVLCRKALTPAYDEVECFGGPLRECRGGEVATMDVDASLFHVPRVHVRVFHDSDHLRIEVRIDVKDVHTGEPNDVTATYRYGLRAARRSRPEFIRQLVRDCVVRTLAHEVDETLRFNGERSFDPHKGEKR